MLNDGKRMMMIRGTLAAALLLGFNCQVTAGETPTKTESTTTTKSRPSVVITTVTTRDVSRRQIYVGRVQAINTVQLTARVEGFLEQRDFAEGSYVKKGQTLFLIEQAAYKAAVGQSEADV
jgi:multidrug efflux pump subunit AcrA (membrane-fusion protein)